MPRINPTDPQLTNPQRVQLSMAAQEMAATLSKAALSQPVDVNALAKDLVRLIKKEAGFKVGQSMARNALLKAVRAARQTKTGITKDLERRAGIIGSVVSFTLYLDDVELAFLKKFGPQFGSRTQLVHAYLRRAMDDLGYTPPEGWEPPKR